MTTPSVSEPVAVGTLTSTDRTAMAMVTTLFFMWGLLTSLNDILVPHLKAILDLNYAEVILIQFFFFCLLHFRDSLRQAYRAYRLQTIDDGWSSNDGPRRCTLYSGRQRSILPLVSCGIDCARSRDDGPASLRESVC